MKFKTILIICAIVLLSFTLAVGGVVVAASRLADGAVRQGVQAQRLIEQTLDLYILAQNYVVRFEERPKAQWYRKYADLEQALESPDLRQQPSEAYLAGLREELAGIKRSFDELSRVSAMAEQNPAVATQVISDLLVKSQRMVSAASEMNAHAEELRTQNRRRADGVIFLLLLLLAVTSIITFGVLRRQILGPLARLQRGTEIIGRGNLDYHADTGLDNEVGLLSRAFDNMTAKLKQAQATLEQKVVDRTRELQAMTARSERLLESIGDGVFAIDRRWNITAWNPAAERLTGWKSEEVLGRPLREVLKLVRARDHEETITFIEDVMLRGEVRSMDADTLLVAKDGREIPVADSCSPIFGEQLDVVDGAIIVFRDVSAERELLKKEREMTQMKDDFLFRTIHDLRSPTTIIRSALDLHAEIESSEGEVRPELEKSIGMIRDASARMAKMIQDLLDIAKGEKAEVHLRHDRVDLGALIATMLAQHAGTMKPKKVSATFVPSDKPPAVIGDEDALKEVFDNLITNAVKYNVEGGQITVSQELRGDMVVTTVADTGIGVAAESLAKLFVPYSRVAGTGAQGTGLGLYIVKKLVEKMGGQVGVTSSVGKGSTFTVSLPSTGS